VSALAKLAGFAVMLAVLFGGGALAGGAIGPDRDSGRSAQGPAEKDQSAHGAESGEHGSKPGAHDRGRSKARPLRGLAVAADGLRVIVDDSELRRGRTESLGFRIVDDVGDTVRDFDVEHTKRLHLIVVRRDLTGFQHLHPKQGADGGWSTRLRLDEAGSYRLFADFSYQDESFTLANDLRVDGAADLKPLASPSRTSVSDGSYDVRLGADHARPGEEADLRFTVTKEGQTVQIERYLGARGHLVALREGDLAFLHVHPTEQGHRAARGDPIGFAATFPTPGRYRLFLQFQHRGHVQTVAFTREVK